MKNLPLQRESIEPRLDGIQKEIKFLRRCGQLSFEEFRKEENLDRVHLHLRFALEGMFHVGSHILSRIPGGRFTEYKEVACRLGEVGIVEKDFAEKKLVPIAGYRNRLTHLYYEVTPEELYKIVNENLTDIESFLEAVGRLLKNPEKLGLTVE